MDRRKILKIIILLISVFFILLLFKSIIVMPSKTGQVLDAVTNKPLEGISLIRTTSIVIPCFECTGERTIRTETTTTNKKGEYKFSSFIKFKSPLNSFYRELLYVNDRSQTFYNEKRVALELQHNQSYESEIVGLGYSKLYGAIFGYKSYLKFQPFNNKIIIKLIPFVSDLSLCEGNKDCIIYNRQTGRNCFLRTDDPPSNVDFCNEFKLSGGKLFDKNFENDFIVCNSGVKIIDSSLPGYEFGEEQNKRFFEYEFGMSDTEGFEVSSAGCVHNLFSGMLFDEISVGSPIANNESCSKLNSELAKNYCFYQAKICDKITTKEIPTSGILSQFRNAYPNVINFQALCKLEINKKSMND